MGEQAIYFCNRRNINTRFVCVCVCVCVLFFSFSAQVSWKEYGGSGFM